MSLASTSPRLSRPAETPPIALSAAAFEFFFDRHPLPLLTVDPTTQACLAANHAAVALYGYSGAEFSALTLPALRVEAAAAGFDPAARVERHRAKDGRELEVEVEARHADVAGAACLLLTVRECNPVPVRAVDDRGYRRLYTTLSQVNQAILRRQDRQSLFACICQIAVDQGGFPLAFVSEVNHTTGEVQRVAAAGRAMDVLVNFDLNIYQPETMTGPTGTALREGRLTASQDIAADARMARWQAAVVPQGLRSFAAIPFRQRGQVVGTLNLYSDQPGFFTVEELHLLEAIGSDLAFALDAMQAEAETRSSRELFHHLFHFSPVPKALVRLRDNTYVDVNPAFERAIGFSRAAIRGKPWGVLRLWADPDLRDRLVARLRHGLPVRDTEVEIYGPGGVLRKGLFYAETIADQEESYFLASIVDVTDEQAVRASLTQAQQHQRLLVSALEAAADGVVITDRNGRIEWVNPAFSRLSGYTLDEVIGRNPRDLVKSGQQDRAFYANMWATIVAGQIWRGELINRRKDGSLYVEEQTITPVRADEDGQITHFVAIKRDISHQQEVETQVRRQERLAAVGQLAAGIAHDFNNIMGVIMLYAQTTARSAALSDRDRERLSSIHEQVQHGAHMIRQILDFSRQTKVDQYPLDFLPVLKEQVKLLQRTLPENIAVNLWSEPGDYVVAADPTRMQQVVMNLAVNARDAMPNGGKLIFTLKRLEVTEGEPAAAGLTPGHWIRLEVADTGTGVPDAVIEHMFEPFFTTKDPGAGTGLGLSQVRSIVDEHGGQITVQSTMGEGTTFTIYLRALQISRPARVVADRDDTPRGQGETVLVVEDNLVLRTAMMDMLEMFGYRVLEAGDGQAALDLLTTTTQAIDAVLTDLVMPNMGGVEFVQTLRRKGYSIPVIPMTGHPLGADLERLRAQGVMDPIAKPITPAQLAQAIALALRKGRFG